MSSLKKICKYFNCHYRLILNASFLSSSPEKHRPFHVLLIIWMITINMMRYSCCYNINELKRFASSDPSIDMILVLLNCDGYFLCWAGYCWEKKKSMPWIFIIKDISYLNAAEVIRNLRLRWGYWLVVLSYLLVLQNILKWINTYVPISVA